MTAVVATQTSCDTARYHLLWLAGWGFRVFLLQTGGPRKHLHDTKWAVIIVDRESCRSLEEMRQAALAALERRMVAQGSTLKAREAVDYTLNYL